MGFLDASQRLVVQAHPLDRESRACPCLTLSFRLKQAAKDPSGKNDVAALPSSFAQIEVFDK